MAKKATEITNHNYDVSGRLIGSQQSATGFLGTWTKEDEARFNAEMANQEWLNNLELIDYQNWYNSPEQQAIRMRQAGLNPDLQGVQSSPSAGASAPKVNAPSGTNNVDTAMQVAGAFLQTISVGHKLVEGVTKSMGTMIQNNQSFGNSVFSALNSFLSNVAPKGVPVLNEQGELIEATSSILDSASVKAFESLFPRGRRRRYAREFLTAFQDSDYHKNLWYGMRGTTEEKRRNLLSWLGSSPYASLDSVLMESMGKVYNAVYDADIKAADARGAKGKYESDLYNTASGVSEGKARNWANHRTENFENIRKEAIDAYNSVIKKFEKQKPVLYNIAEAIGPVLVDYFLGLTFANYNRL